MSLAILMSLMLYVSSNAAWEKVTFDKFSSLTKPRIRLVSLTAEQNMFAPNSNRIDLDCKSPIPRNIIYNKKGNDLHKSFSRRLRLCQEPRHLKRVRFVNKKRHLSKLHTKPAAPKFIFKRLKFYNKQLHHRPYRYSNKKNHTPKYQGQNSQDIIDEVLLNQSNYKQSPQELLKSEAVEDNKPKLALSPVKDRVEFHMQGHQGPNSYLFGFDTGDGKNRQFRFEEKQKNGTVKGQYGYYDASGKLRVVNYTADPKVGYQEENHEFNANILSM